MLLRSLLIAIVPFVSCSIVLADEFNLHLRYQQETEKGSGRFHTLQRSDNWNATETAIIVCDVWDYHHCLNAVRRVEEFAPRLNKVLIEARKRGAIIIHSPSDCMPAYAEHPARMRAIKSPAAKSLPSDIKSWCSRIPAEEKADYPIDQSDGGEDDDPAEHADWAAKLKAMGRNPGMPWKAQSKLIEIDDKLDFISDRGDEVWNVLEANGIKNVILTGVHVNMCVLGRPFGLRQMARNGKNVVLMRDMTDAMYNPKRWPYVSHFTGNDLIISHIERHVCATITSDQVLGGKPFRFKNDNRPHLAIVMAEREYKTNISLPGFVSSAGLGKDFRVSYVHADVKDRNHIPGLETLKEADIALISVRRRLLKPDIMKIVRDFVAAGKPVVGIRTASHAFSLNKGNPPEGYAEWPEFDAQVFGGNYHGHYGNKLKSSVRFETSQLKGKLLVGINGKPIPQGGSLYQTKPLNESATVLATGLIDGAPESEAEPIAWTFKRADGGKSFYTALGHVDDFQNPVFVKLLTNAIYWAADLKQDQSQSWLDPSEFENHWLITKVPTTNDDVLKNNRSAAWFRCAVRITEEFLKGERLTISLADDKAKAWFNGHLLEANEKGEMTVNQDWIAINDANLLVVRVPQKGIESVPVVQSGSNRFTLKGRWQFRLGDKSEWSNIPLPAKFGASTDILFEPE